MELIKLETLAQFKELKSGDIIIVHWSDYNIKQHEDMSKIMIYKILKNEKDKYEIICKEKGNHFFNYGKFIEKKSEAEKVILVRVLDQE